MATPGPDTWSSSPSSRRPCPRSPPTSSWVSRESRRRTSRGRWEAAGGRLRQCLRLPVLAPARHPRRRDGGSGAGGGEGRAQHAYPRGGRARGAERSRRLVGRVMEVLVDGAARKDAGQASGRTRCNRVNFDPAGRDLIGEVVAVRITEALPHSLRARAARADAARAGGIARIGGTRAMWLEMKVKGLTPTRSPSCRSSSCATRRTSALAHLGGPRRSQRHRPRA